MTDSGSTAAEVDHAAHPRSAPSARAHITLAAAVLTLAAAAIVLLRSRDDLWSAIESARGAPAWMLIVAVALPLLNWALTTGIFWMLTRRVGKVGVIEMAALMGASWLANYLPLKPGLAGRVAYHRAVHGIPIAASSLVVVQALALGVLATLLLIGATLVLSRQWLGAAGPALAASILVVGLGLALVHARSLDARGSDPPHPIALTLVAVLGLRLADAAVWVGRYWLAFQIVGTPVTMVQASALAAVGQAVACLPVIGSALGVREWAIAGLASALPPTGGQDRMLSFGLVADLFNRVVEVVLAVVVGTACSVYLARRHGRASSPSTGPATGPAPAQDALPGPPGTAPSPPERTPIGRHP